ncbi:protein kinase C theta type isoform X2 [Xenopus laevis]|uniref:Protein kinase C theta type isoform X2 n=1 Tax=Xenopus laevis TaxID=8355 RepID=A0A8J0TGI9_XENLA|nr:protein kinase C theta type isoform X2 [Xenopus laevis]
MLASLTNSTKHVALKIIKKLGTSRHQQSIKSEARVLRISGECPFLCRGLAAFQTELHAFMVMECESKTSLSQMIRNRGKLEMKSVIFYSAELVIGLQFLHSRGIVHRDLKLSNILISKDGHVKIADFGVIAEGVYYGKKIKNIAGTKSYMAPEIFLNRPYDSGVDWWAFGIILCGMATGQSPFNAGQDKNYLAYLVTRTRPVYPTGLSTKARALLDELLEKVPEMRLGTRGYIRSHPFFHSINWADLESLKVPPPLKPQGFSLEDLTAKYKGPLSFLQDIPCNVSSDDKMVQEFSFQNSRW